MPDSNLHKVDFAFPKIKIPLNLFGTSKELSSAIEAAKGALHGQFAELSKDIAPAVKVMQETQSRYFKEFEKLKLGLSKTFVPDRLGFEELGQFEIFGPQMSEAAEAARESLRAHAEQLERLISEANKKTNRAIEPYSRLLNVWVETSRRIRKFEETHPLAMRYFELYKNDDPEFINLLRRHLKKTAGRKGFPDVYICDDGTLYSYTLGDLPEVELSDHLNGVGKLALWELEKLPLRIWDKIRHKITGPRRRKTELQEESTVWDSIKAKEIITIFNDFESLTITRPFEPFTDLTLLNDTLDIALKRLPEKQFEIIELIYFKENKTGNSITEAEAARMLGISRVAVNKRHRKALVNLKAVLSPILNN